MSRALSVYHGRFGRATLYELNRPMTPHAHREGHLIFYLGGAHASVRVSGQINGLSERTAVAINSWELHDFIPGDFRTGSIFLVLYVSQNWFECMARGAPSGLRFGRSQIDISPRIRSIVDQAVFMLEEYDTAENFDGMLYELTDQCFQESWGMRDRSMLRIAPPSSFMDFRVRKTIRLLADRLGTDVNLDEVARQAGLSRPHFYKLFRRQIGLTPNVYLNTLRMETAVEWLVQTGRSITDIAFELGFSCQSVFTRFFSAHVGMAPTDYRRAAQILRN